MHSNRNSIIPNCNSCYMIGSRKHKERGESHIRVSQVLYQELFFYLFKLRKKIRTKKKRKIDLLFRNGKIINFK